MIGPGISPSFCKRSSPMKPSKGLVSSPLGRQFLRRDTACNIERDKKYMSTGRSLDAHERAVNLRMCVFV